MNNQFDELTKGMAQSVTRRAALKKLGVGLAGMALACFGLANKSQARGPGSQKCLVDPTSGTNGYLSGYCGNCNTRAFSPDCSFGAAATWKKMCLTNDGFPVYLSSIPCSR